MKNWKNFRREDFAIIWGFGLFCGGTDSLRAGITLQSVFSFAGALLLGFMVWAVFVTAGTVFEDEPLKRQWLYEVIILLVITFISTGAPWR